MIKRGHSKLSISQQCKLVSLSRSAFYDTPVGVDAATLSMMKEITRVFTKYSFFGSRQITAYLRREGVVVGRHRVRRLMAKVGLEAIQDGFQARKVIKNCMAFYNTDRPHSALDRQTPDDAYWGSLEQAKAA